MNSFFRTAIDRDELGSTSDLARDLVESGPVALPLVVRARRQTAGRGRGENRWWSDAGSLTFTLAIDPAEHGLCRDHEPRLALAVAVGLIEAIETLNLGPIPGLGIRWPNDVEIAGRKLAGILPERIETGHGSRLLIGVGLNVASDFRASPDEVRMMATSLREMSEARWDADVLLSAILEGFPALLARLAGDDPGLAGAWIARDTLYGEPLRLAVGPNVVVGRGGGIDRSGGLIVVDERGPATYFGGQVLR
jgi:BirA family biotin operon repressor/biotin-[acetyl-CoA-carboxylase] ligase